MAEDTKKTIQQEIDYQLGEAGSFMHSFVLRDKDGDCDVPNNVHIRFYNCTLNSLKSTKNNNFYFNDCTFSGNPDNFAVNNSSLIIHKSTINTKLTFTKSKIELLECEVNNGLVVRDVSFLKSIKSTWTAGGEGGVKDIGILCSKNSTVESYKDTWSAWTQYFWKADDTSYIKINSPVKLDDIKEGIGFTDKNSTIELNKATSIAISEGSVAFKSSNKSTISLKNIDKLSTSKSLFSIESGSRLTLTNIPSIICSGDEGIVLSLDDSTATVSNCPDISASGSGATAVKILNDGSLSIFGLKTIRGAQSAISIETGNLTLVGDNTTIIISTNDSAIQANTGSSNIFIKNIDKIESASGKGLDLSHSKLTVINANTIQGGSGSYALNASASSINLTNITNMNSKGLEVIYLNANSKLVASVIDNITSSSGSSGAAIKIDTNSVFSGKDILTINGIDSGVVVDGGSRFLLKNNNLIQGQSGNGLVIGRNCSVTGTNLKSIKGATGNGLKSVGAGSRFKFKNVTEISGSTVGIDINDTDLDIDNSGLTSSSIKGNSSGLNANSQNEGSYNINLVGPISVEGSPTACSITGYVVKESGVTWTGDVNLTSNLVESNFSSVSADLGLNKSFIKQRRGKVSGKVTATVNSIFDSMRSAVDGQTSATNSIIRLNGSLLDNLSLTSSAYFGLNSKLGNVDASDSFVGAFSNRIGTITPTGKSTVLGGALSDSNIDFSGDPDVSTPVSIFSAGAGDFAVQADGDLIFECYNLKQTLRNDLIVRADNKIDMQSNQDATVTSVAGAGKLTGSTQVLLTCGASTITMTSSSIVLASASITV